MESLTRWAATRSLLPMRMERNFRSSNFSPVEMREKWNFRPKEELRAMSTNPMGIKAWSMNDAELAVANSRIESRPLQSYLKTATNPESKPTICFRMESRAHRINHRQLASRKVNRSEKMISQIMMSLFTKPKQDNFNFGCMLWCCVSVDGTMLAPCVDKWHIVFVWVTCLCYYMWMELLSVSWYRYRRLDS